MTRDFLRDLNRLIHVYRYTKTVTLPTLSLVDLEAIDGLHAAHWGQNLNQHRGSVTGTTRRPAPRLLHPMFLSRTLIQTTARRNLCAQTLGGVRDMLRVSQSATTS